MNTGKGIDAFSSGRRMQCLVFGLTLLVTMGISSLIPVLPSLAREFGLAGEASWRVIAAFALPGLLCIPFVGVWADRYGRKRILIPSLLLFAFGGLACAFAQSYPQLLIFRMIQGAGSAAFGLLYATIIADTWRGAERARVMSLNAAVLGFGTAVSPALGGALAVVHWRLVFVLPLLALPLALLALRLPLAKPGEKGSLGDYVRKTLSLARKPRTMLLLVLTLLTFLMLSGPIITCFPLLAEESFFAGPLESGLIIAAASLAAGLAAFSLPRLYRLFSVKSLLLASMALYALAFGIMPRMPGLVWLLVPVTLYGFGQGMNIPLVSTLLTGQAPEAQRAGIMALNALLLRLGQNLGPALFGTLAGLMGPGEAIAAGAFFALGTALLVALSPLPSLDGSR